MDVKVKVDDGGRRDAGVSDDETRGGATHGVWMIVFVVVVVVVVFVLSNADVDARTAQSKSAKNLPGIAAADADFSRHLCRRSSARSTSNASNRSCPLPGSKPNVSLPVIVVVVVAAARSSPTPSVHTARLTNASHASAHASASHVASTRNISALFAAFFANRVARALGPARKPSHHALHPSSKSSRTTSADSASRSARSAVVGVAATVGVDAGGAIVAARG